MDLQRPTVVELFSRAFPSGLGIDAAKNHTGLCIWNGTMVETVGFALDEIDQSDPHWEYKMRCDFKRKLASYIEGKYFQVVVIEDCYGGENFDTVRKLLAIQTVIDELLDEGRVTCGEFYRRRESEWLSDFRRIYKSQVGLKAKVATQEILEYLNFDFYMQYKNYPDKEKEAKESGLPTKTSFFFEDRCDATAQLLSVAISKLSITAPKETKPKMRELQLVYLNGREPAMYTDCQRIIDGPIKDVVLNPKALEKSILDCMEMYPDSVIRACLPVDKIGVFGAKHKFTFYDDGEGWLFCFRK